jgi:hypothetical protein
MFWTSAEVDPPNTIYHRAFGSAPRFPTSGTDKMTTEMTAAEYQQHLVDTGQVSPPIPQSKGKYSAKPIVIDDIRFASTAEGNRYMDLKRLRDAGEIADLECQPKFPIVVNGHKICTYLGDFRYVDVATGKITVEDVKGMSTPVYRLKKKLVAACHDVQIVEVKR